MEMTKLPELKEHVSHDEDARYPVGQQGDDSPRQSEIIDWLAGLLSAPPLDEIE